MKRKALALAIAICLLFAAVPGLVGFIDARQPPQPIGRSRLPLDRVIIGYKARWHKPNIISDISTIPEAKVVMEEDRLNFVVVRTKDPQGLINRMKQNPNVRYAQLDEICYALLEPNDPGWSNQWGPQDIYAPQAWDTQLGSSSVTIAIVDTGVDYTHEDLTGRVVLGHDYANNDNDPWDDNGHGTHCAGIAGATINNNRGIAGIAQCTIMAVKVLDSGGSGYYSWVTAGIREAADNGAGVISMSLGGSSDNQALHDACDYAYETKNVVVVAAAGNSGPGDNTVLYPAKYDSVIAISALQQGDTITSWSSRGPEVELAAPGNSIYSCYPGGYRSMSGTSMAAPHVSGVAGLVRSQNLGLSASQVRTKLQNTAEDLGAGGRDHLYGYGKVDANEAVLNA
jgi:subtilisin family serine protease